MPARLLCGPVAALRRAAARRWLTERPPAAPLLIVGATHEAAVHMAREAGAERVATFGWRALTLTRLATQLADELLVRENRVPVARLVLEALCARVVAELKDAERLGRYAAISGLPGLPRAFVSTLHVIRMAGLVGTGTDLDPITEAYEEALGRAGFADRAFLFRRAVEVARQQAHLLLALPTLFLDVPLENDLEHQLVQALAARSPDVLVTVPEGDTHSLSAYVDALGVEPVWLNQEAGSSTRRLQLYLFAEATPPEGVFGDDVEMFSAPGESRESVEIARRLLREASRGVRFDRMAVLLRSPALYRAQLEEALGRAGIPTYFATGTLRPDPSGRALLSLLSCAAERLSARRFAEYLSLAEVPDASPEGEPPPAPAAGDQWIPPEEEALPAVFAELLLPAAEEAEPTTGPEAPVAGGTLRAPHRWEQLLVEAAVIGGIDRWRRRLDGLQADLQGRLDALDDPESRWAVFVRRQLSDLEHLRSFALPLLELLEGFQEPVVWGGWFQRLSVLATRALRRPERVLAALAELAPMAPVGPVSLAEVRLVLSNRLTQMVLPPPVRPYGRVFIGPIGSARGLSFDIVFVPGLAEKIFPQKVAEDPVLPDAGRERLGLPTNVDRVAGERLALRLAIGAAERRVVISFARLDLQLGRPRVPSFYGLEILRAAEGRLPGFDELSRRAERVGGGRVGWPAPPSPKDAIDELEYDLALLDQILERPPEQTQGMARFLLSANRSLERALRFRAERWTRTRWTSADGFVEPSPEALAALRAHGIGERSYSPTALQHFAVCPYRFFLDAIQNLTPREEPEAIEEMDPLWRGRLTHDVLFRLLQRLRADGLLPTTPGTLDAARAHLEDVLPDVAAQYRDQLAPAIERVWDDGVAQVRADIIEILRRASGDETGWIPVRFELAFGLAERRGRDVASRTDPVRIDCGLQLRGSIDLVEQNLAGALRVTDYKTGKDRTGPDVVVAGGEILQPVLYGLVTEKLFPDAHVESGRLYFCTFAAGFDEKVVPLDAEARAATGVVAEVLDDALTRGFLPAAPKKDACKFCDFVRVCGSEEERRTARKPQEPLTGFARIRDLR